MNNKKGFTLIELMVSLSIIIVLLGVTISSVNGARMRSRDAKRVADLQTIQAALEQYSLGESSHTYPPDNDPSNQALACKGIDTTTNPCLARYLSIVPQDPQGGAHVYGYASPACFQDSSAAADGSGVTLKKDDPSLTCLKRNSSYGLHTGLETGNVQDAKRDATPTKNLSYDLIP